MSRIVKNFRFDPLTVAMIRNLREFGDYGSDTALVEECIHAYYLCCSGRDDPLLNSYISVLGELNDGGLGANGPQVNSDQGPAASPPLES